MKRRILASCVLLGVLTGWPAFAWELENPDKDLTLAKAMSLALLQNPTLAAYSWEIRAREAEALQAGARPNPILGVEVENFAGSGDYSGLGGSETTLALSQLLRLGGKGTKQERLADLDRQLADWDYETQRINILADVTQAFNAVLAAQERVTIANQLRDVAVEFLETVSRRVTAGGASPVERTRARVALAESELLHKELQGSLVIDRLRLGELLGLAAPRFAAAVGNLEAVELPPPLVQFTDQAGMNPYVRRWETEMERQQANLALQKALGKPDLTVFAGVRRFAETSSNGLILGVELPLPVSDRNQRAQEASGHRVSEARESQRAARTLVASQIAQVHAAWTAAYNAAVTLTDTIIPDAQTALETARDGYGRGLFRLTDVLDTQRTLFELHDQRVAALENYHTSRAAMDRLVGLPMTNQEDSK